MGSFSLEEVDSINNEENMAFEKENYTLFIDTTLLSMASIIGAILTRNDQRHTYKKIGDKLFKFVAEDLVRRNVPYRVAADLLGVSLRTFHRKMKGQSSIESCSETSSILLYLTQNPELKKSVLYRHFYYLSPDFLGSCLRDLKRLGHISIDGKIIRFNEKRSRQQEIVWQTYLHFVLLQYTEISLEELVKVVPLRLHELNSTLEILIQDESIILEDGKYRAIERLEVTDSCSASKEELLLFSLISMIECQCRSIAIRLDSKESTDLSKGAVRAFRVEKNSDEYQNVIEGLAEIRQSLEKLWVDSEASKGKTFITSFIGYAVWGPKT